MNFDEAFSVLIGHEGGYVNDQRDPGGETKFGISRRAYPNEDIASLTIEAAKEIYRRDYWDRAACDSLPPVVAFHVFDAAVNSGIIHSIRFLQRAVGVDDDGRVGPLTIRAIQKMDSVAVAARFNGHRLDFMTRLSTWDVFGKGWARRVASNLMEA